MSTQPAILCAVDLSWRSNAAFSHAVALAKSRDARLDLVFAVPTRRPYGWRVRERAAQLAELRRQASAAAVDMTVSVQHGDPADVILAHAGSPHPGPADVIVLGAPRRRGIERLWHPSVAQAVVRRADRPTLIVPGASFSDGHIGVPFRRVLCAIDSSPASMVAIAEALRIVRTDAGTMHLLHVVDVAHPAVPRVALEFDATDHTRELTEHAWRRFRLLVPRSEALRGRVQLQVTVGLVVDEIIRSANDSKADLVVLGVADGGWLSRLVSATAIRAVRRLECPVLGVPAVRKRAAATAAQAARIAA